jgi:hypothetical protein
MTGNIAAPLHWETKPRWSKGQTTDHLAAHAQQLGQHKDDNSPRFFEERLWI